MRSFRLRITDKVYFEAEDGKRSGVLAAERRKLEEEDYPKIVAGEEATAEAFWQASEALRRGKAIGLPPAKIQELTVAAVNSEIAFKKPRVDLNIRNRELYDELVILTGSYRREIVKEIEFAMEEVLKARSAQTVSSEKRLIDKGNRGESEITVRLLEDNFESVEKIMAMLNNLRFKVRNSLNASSHAEILQAVKEAEAVINAIDTGTAIRREISESEWRDLRENKVL